MYIYGSIHVKHSYIYECIYAESRCLMSIDSFGVISGKYYLGGAERG